MEVEKMSEYHSISKEENNNRRGCPLLVAMLGMKHQLDAILGSVSFEKSKFSHHLEYK